MSTEVTPRTRRTSRRSNATTDQPSPLSSSPMGTPRIGRPSPKSTSTSSSALSKLSNTFDIDESKPPRSVSPVTPPCETLPPTGSPMSTPSIQIDSQHAGSLVSSELKVRRKRSPRFESPPGSTENADTPSKKPQKRPSPKIFELSRDGEGDHRTHLTPGNNAMKQRASSAPTLSARHDDRLDKERWRELPGRYESQNSNTDIDTSSEDEQMLPSITSKAHKRDIHTGSFVEPAIPDEISAVDRERQHSDDSFEEDSFLSDEHLQASEVNWTLFDSIRSLLPFWTSMKWLFQLMQSSPTQVPFSLEPEALPSAFTPFTCEDSEGDSKARKLNGKRHINSRILGHILKGQGKPKNPGYVYIFETKDYGPNLLKIGQSKYIPDKRMKNLVRECGLKLHEVPDKDQNPFYYFELVENLVHEELDDDRLRLKCDRPKCTKVHREWFRIHRQNAFRALDKWRRWLLKRPFDERGQLTPYWADRAERLRISIADVDWNEWIQPSRWDEHAFVLRPYVSRGFSSFKKHFARSRKDLCFWAVGMAVTLLSFVVHGGKGVIWTFVGLLLL